MAKNRKKFNIPIQKVPYPKMIITSISISLITIILILFSRNRLPPEVPLFYGFSEGEQQLSSRQALIIPCVISIAITILNMVLSYFSKNDYIKKILIISAFILSIFSAVTIFRISLLVGNF